MTGVKHVLFDVLQLPVPRPPFSALEPPYPLPHPPPLT